MTRSLHVEVVATELERVEADVVVAGFFTGDRPLRGGAGRADWRLCGLLSSLLRQDRLRGALGEAALVPTDGALASPRLLLLGCGAAERLERVGFRQLCANAFARLADLRASSAAVSLPLGGAASGIPLDVSAATLVESALATPHAPSPLVLVVPAGSESGLESVIRRVGQGQRGVELEISVRRPAPRSSGERTHGAAQRPALDPQVPLSRN